LKIALFRRETQSANALFATKAFANLLFILQIGKFSFRAAFCSALFLNFIHSKVERIIVLIIKNNRRIPAYGVLIICIN